jgi:hypothetical protein
MRAEEKAGRHSEFGMRKAEGGNIKEAGPSGLEGKPCRPKEAFNLR